MVIKQLIIVPHCFISDGFSPSYDSETKEIFEVMLRCNVKLMQLPCPRLMFLSLTGTLNAWPLELNCESKSTVVYSLKMLYNNSISVLVAQVQKFKSEGISLAGVIGVEGAPTCQACDSSVNVAKNTGLFMKVLCRKLKENDFHTSIVNIKNRNMLANLNC